MRLSFEGSQRGYVFVADELEQSCSRVFAMMSDVIDDGVRNGQASEEWKN